MKHEAIDGKYLIASYLFFPAAFIAAFMWLEWRGLGIASLGTSVVVFMVYNRLTHRLTEGAVRIWKRFLLIAGALIAAYGLVASLALLANRWEALGLLVLASVLFFGAIFLTLSISFVSGLRAAGTHKWLLFWLVPQGTLLSACILTLFIAD